MCQNPELTAAMLKADIALLEYQRYIAERASQFDLAGLLNDCIQTKRRALAEEEANDVQ